MPGILGNDVERFTYADYVKWPDDERWELIEGVAFDMSPAPSTYHQEISMNLSAQIYRYLKENLGKCKVFAAPFDVRFPEKKQADEEIISVVQPDISVICDPLKLDEKGCKGAPNLVVEIISPYTVKKDMKNKLDLYEKHHVPEYWVIYPEEKIVLVYKLNLQNRYDRESIYSKEDDIEIILNGKSLVINLESVF